MALSTLVAAMVLAPAQDSRFTKDLLPVGSSAPSFELEGTNGKVEWKGSGKAAVVAFWHVGSRESALLLGELDAIRSEYGKDLAVYSVNVGDAKDRVVEFLKANGSDLNTGLASGAGAGLKDSYGVKGYPTFYVADKTGKIVFRAHKPDKSALDKAIKSALG